MKLPLALLGFNLGVELALDRFSLLWWAALVGCLMYFHCLVSVIQGRLLLFSLWHALLDGVKAGGHYFLSIKRICLPVHLGFEVFKRFTQRVFMEGQCHCGHIGN